MICQLLRRGDDDRVVEVDTAIGADGMEELVDGRESPAIRSIKLNVSKNLAEVCLGYYHAVPGTLLASGTFVSIIALYNSSVIICNTLATPSAPAAANPQHIGRPTRTPLAPRASAFKTSVPLRKPPSIRTSILPSNSFNYMWKDFDRGLTAVQNPASMIRDHNGVCPGTDGL